MNKFVLLALWCFSFSLCALHQPTRLYKKGKTESLKLLLNVHPREIPEKEIQQLVLEGADPNVCADSGFCKGTSWLLSWREAKFNEASGYNFLVFLLNNGGNPNKGWNIMSPLMNACADGDYASAHLLIAAGADVRARSDIVETTPLIFAVGDPTRPKLYRAVLVKLLLDKGADPDIELPDKKGETPMSLARKGNLHDIIAMFEEYKKRVYHHE